ncbi:GTPase [Thalassoglobus polymorphus]|uniref:GTPase Der n=1 Tax=Thalassoglobus polymorphus TaxID=2527994 RepID=A0A517QR90_9PLAN|nr:GTPase [Thalassoglobus polymorphus]QDT34125.1 GTPase Der [Thalassoglobus polymorphus]
MVSIRSIILGILYISPVFVYVGFGGYALWQTGLFRWTWWIIPGCWFIAFLTAKLWPAKPPRSLPNETPKHWTQKDEQALRIVEEYQNQVDECTPEELTDLQFYLHQSQDLARSLGKYYHPKGKELYSSLTVVEVLAAIRLAVEDLEIWFHESVPGSHLITIQQWKYLGKAPKWAKRVSEVGWMASLLLNPLNIAKYLSSKATLQPIAEELRTEFLAAVYLRFTRQVGFYLIEMNSGRLRRGADRYRATFGAHTVESLANPSTIPPDSVIVAVVGQVKAGKSSVINALIGKQEAVVDILPSTKTVSRYRLPIPDTNESLTFLDTPGYADAGLSRSEFKELEQAIQEADVILLVSDAHSPGKAADVELLETIQNHAKTRPELKIPPVVLCLTHIDLLSPMMEWTPPYDWDNPSRPKEESIHAAVNSAQELFGTSVRETVAVCSDVARNRAFHIEGLLAALLTQLDAGKSVALLKAYEKNLDQDRLSVLFDQLKASGKTIVQMWGEERLKLPKPSV